MIAVSLEMSDEPLNFHVLSVERNNVLYVTLILKGKFRFLTM